MAENTKSNSATGEKYIRHGDKHSNENNSFDWIDERIKGVTGLTNKIRKLAEERVKQFKQKTGWEEGYLLMEIAELSDEKTMDEAILVALKKCSDNFFIEEYLYYLREINNFLRAGYPVEKVFEMVGEINSKTVFDIVK